MADNTMTNTLGDSAAGCGLCLSYFKIAFDRGGVDVRLFVLLMLVQLLTIIV
jgi:hypothetical protein